MGKGAGCNDERTSLFGTADGAWAHLDEGPPPAEPVAAPHVAFADVLQGAPDWITADNLPAILASNQAKYLPMGFAGGNKDTYSPTMIETYIRCPRGWFIQNIAGVAGPRSQRTFDGTSAHKMIEIADEHGLEAAKAELEKLPEDRQVPVWELVEAAYHKYLEQWPNTERIRETKMTHTLPSGRKVRGIADRVDIMGDDVLVIDWKLRCFTGVTDYEKRSKQIQRYLYPMMAADTYKKNPLGMLYVSLEGCRHEGSLVKELPIGTLYQDGNLDYNWAEEAAACEILVDEKIHDIESGKWWEKGKKCPPWCACKHEEVAARKWNPDGVPASGTIE